MIFRVAREFGLHPDRVAMEMPLAQLFAWNACAIENDPWGGWKRSDNGYVAQEAANLLAKKKI